jgi:hypothetical protein
MYRDAETLDYELMSEDYDAEFDAAREREEAEAREQEREEAEAQDAPASVLALLAWNEELLHDDTVELTAAARKELAALIRAARAVAGAGAAPPAPAVVSQETKPSKISGMSVTRRAA